MANVGVDLIKAGFSRKMKGSVSGTRELVKIVFIVSRRLGHS